MTLTKEEVETITLTDRSPVFLGDFEPQGDLIFVFADGTEMVRLCSNGDFKVKGRLVTNDMELYEGFKQFLAGVKGEV